MSLILYGTGPSRSFRCLWALEECGLEFDYRNLDLQSADDNGAKSPDYLNLNVQGKVPSLQHNDFVLTESGAILNYIAALSNSDTLIPKGVKARAKYDELSFFVLSELEQPLWTNGKHRFAIPEEQRVPQILETAKWEFAKALNALQRLSTLTPYALGEDFTFADILVAQTINWAERFKFDVPTELIDYRDRLYSRNAAERAKAYFS